MLRKKSVLAGSRMREVAVRFRRERDGNIAILFAFMIGVLFLFAGGAVDFTRQNTVRADLVESLDAAGLAIAQLDAMNGPAIRNLSDEAREEYLKNYGRQFFMSNFPHSDMIDQEWGISNFNVDFLITDMTITPKASGRLKTLLLPIGEFLVTGHPANESALAQVSLDAETEITRSRVGNIEVGLVLDITGSMAGSKIADLHDAAKELVDILVLPDQSNFYTKVAIAPYSMAVNVGAYASGARGSIAAGKSITDVTWKDGTAKTITNAAWKSGSAKSISNVETLDPVRVTASNHGFSNGDKIWIQDVVSSGSGSKKLSNKINDDTYTVTSVSGSTFRLSGVDGTGWNGTYSSGGTAQKCATTSCEIVVTANSHGLSTGDYAYVTGVSGMTQINGNIYQVTKLDSNNVILNGAVGTSYNSYSSPNTGTITKCKTANCELVVTANTHGFSTDDYLHVKGIVGLTPLSGTGAPQINNNVTNSSLSDDVWKITKLDVNAFALSGTTGPYYSAYTSGGSAYCTNLGCQYLYFQPASGAKRAFEVSNCVSERTGAQAYADAAPGANPVGLVYPGPVNKCPPAAITPLSSDKTALKSAIDGLVADGTTAGHIGIAWGWYLVSPNFASLFPAASKPAAYTVQDVTKAVVIMTDGEFNTQHCAGVVSKDSEVIYGYSPSTEHSACDAPNGSSFSQAQSLCTSIKAKGIRVYTVGFMVGNYQGAQDILLNCASSPSQYYPAEDGAALKKAFENIAHDIARLHISR